MAGFAETRGAVSDMVTDAQQFLPELALLVGAVVGLVVGLFVPRRRQWVVHVIGAGTLAVALAVALAELREPARALFDGSYALDATTGAARIVVLAGTLLVLGLVVEPFRGHAREAEVTVLLLFASLGALLLAGTTDLMLLIVGYLLSSAPLYALSGWRQDDRGTEASAKMFLMGALLGVLMLYGIALLYGLGGVTAYGELAQRFPAGVGLAATAGVIGVLAGLVFKAGAVPGHFWVPDVAEGAPAPIAAYVTSVPKAAGVLAIGRLLLEVVPTTEVDWRLLVALLAAASMLLGTFGAFWQVSPRRLLGYSSVAQVGFMLMAVPALGLSPLAPGALNYFVAAYVVANLGVFAVVIELHDLRALQDYRGLARTRPDLALVLVVCLLSLVGIPPLGGFVGKLGLFAAAWDGGYEWLAVIAAGTTVASVFYTLRWVAPVWASAEATAGRPLLAGTWARMTAWSAALVTIVIGVAGQALLGPLG